MERVYILVKMRYKFSGICTLLVRQKQMPTPSTFPLDGIIYWVTSPSLPVVVLPVGEGLGSVVVDGLGVAPASTPRGASGPTSRNVGDTVHSYAPSYDPDQTPHTTRRDTGVLSV